MKSSRSFRFGLFGVVATAALLLSACSSTSPTGESSTSGSTKTSQSSQESAATETTSSEASVTDTSSAEPPATEESTSEAASNPLAFDQALFDMLPSEIQQSKTIKVANPFTASWVFLEEDGKTLSGPAPDFTKALGTMMGVSFDWIESPFADLIPGIQSGKFDVGWGSITDTKERQAVVTFVDYAQSFNEFFVLKDNPKGVTGLDDSLCGLKASSLPGSAQLAAIEAQSEKCVADGKAKIETAAYAGTPEALLALRSEKTDAFLGTFTSIVHNLRTGGQSDLYQAIGPVEPITLSGLAVAKDNTQLAKALQAGMQKLAASGEYEKILKDYGYEETALPVDRIAINGATE